MKTTRLVNRLGNKAAIAHKIVPFMPPHHVYVEPFFGGGGMFFNKPKAPINHLNDLDDDITNLYFVLKNNAHALIEYL